MDLALFFKKGSSELILEGALEQFEVRDIRRLVADYKSIARKIDALLGPLSDLMCLIRSLGRAAMGFRDVKKLTFFRSR